MTVSQNLLDRLLVSLKSLESFKANLQVAAFCGLRQAFKQAFIS